ncbi:MAG: DUF2868 domain-containing protein [Rubrivivax sp.]|nr:DUF2868 domain-containing protein [Rubrivivax sp.]
MPADAAPARFLDERARHALQRLAPRDAAIARWQGRRLWRWTWLLAALALGLLAGLAVDAVGSAQHRPARAAGLGRHPVEPRRLRRAAAAAWPAAWRPPGRLAGTPAGRWARARQRAAGHLHRRLGAARAARWRRAALLLHAAAAALAAGLVAGMYLRGLVLDYRAGWESTFLEPASVQALLATLLAPASALTGIGIPDEAAISALRVGPGVAAGAPAAPWIHLYAAMLALCVILPRSALAVWAALRGAWAARGVKLSPEDPYLQQLLLQGRGAAPRVRVLPHGAAPSPQAVLGLRELLAGALGAEMQLRLAAPVAYGGEEGAGARPAEPDTTLLVALVDLAATPEADTHGRLLRELRAAAPALPLLLLADEAGFARRFGQLPERLAQRARLAAARRRRGRGLAVGRPRAAGGRRRRALRAGAAGAAACPLSAGMATVTLSLVSHTNVGKTTLARTLLAADIGEVRDAPHVTEFADGHELIATPTGDRLRLWDTPGFGDSARLVQRLRREGSALGWFLSQVWDRWRDRAFWSSQRALHHVREQSDVVLYLVNAAESPAAAGYVAPEMELLQWVGKPVLVLLNQLGAPRAPADEAADLAAWRTQLARWPLVRGVLPLDAFARCWVHEARLLHAVQALLQGAGDTEKAAAMARLTAAWTETARAAHVPTPRCARAGGQPSASRPPA